MKTTDKIYFKKYKTYLGNSSRMERFVGDTQQGFINKDTFEDEWVLRKIDSIFHQNKGYSFKMPPAGESVILVSSGGLDSTAIWGILMQKYRLSVYPIHFTGTKKKENDAFRYFYKYYKRRFPSLCRSAFNFKYNAFFTFNNSTFRLFNNDAYLLFANLIRMKSLFPEKDCVVKPSLTSNIGRLFHYILRGMETALYLQAKEGIIIRNIFVGFIPENAVISRETTLTVLRTFNLTLCLLLNDFRWQFTAPALESENGVGFTRNDLLNYYNRENIPVERTWSCAKNGRYHCGMCLSCLGRQGTFRYAGITDKTVYKKPMSIKDIKLNLGIKRFIAKIKLIIFSTLSIFEKENFSATNLPTNSLKKNSILRIKENIVFYKKRNDTMIIYYPKNNFLEKIELNRTGSYIFDTIKNGSRSLSEILHLVKEHYSLQDENEIKEFIANGLGRYFIINNG